MKNKFCHYCNTAKPESKFYKHPHTTDGRSPKCKECQIAYTTKRLKTLSKNPEFKQKERDRANETYNRLYKGKPKDKVAKEKIRKAYYDRFPEKKLAQRISSLMPRKKGCHLHHWSYNITDLVSLIELPVKEHHKLHRYMVYDQERLMYRRIDTNELLDTKEKHIAYYEEIRHNS